MKKWTALLLAALMIVSLTACGGSAPAPGTTAAPQTTAPQTTAAPSESETPAESTAPVTTAAPTQPETTQPEATPAATQAQDSEAILIDNITVVDNEACTFTFVSGELKQRGGADFVFRMKNKTDSMNVRFNISDTAINGWMLANIFTVTLAPGEETEKTLSFSRPAFEECGLTTADKMLFGLQITGNDGSSTKSYVNTLYSVNLTRNGAQYVSPEREKRADETEIVKDENLSFIILGTKEDPIWGYTVEVFAENMTADRYLGIKWEDVTVNGHPIDPSWGVFVSPACKRLGSVSFSNNALEKAGVDKVEEITFTLWVYDRVSKTDVLKKSFTYRPGK